MCEYKPQDECMRYTEQKEFLQFPCLDFVTLSMGVEMLRRHHHQQQQNK